MRFSETSAKDGTNVSDAFHDIAKDVVSKLLAAGGDVAYTTGSSGGATSSTASVGTAAKKDSSKGGKGCAMQ